VQAQGYAVSLLIEPYATTDPSITLEQLDLELRSAHGLFFVDTHGSTSGYATEAFINTDEGRQARDDRYTYYLSQAYRDNIDIYKSYASDDAGNILGYHISIRPAANAARFASANTIVLHATCYGHTYEDTAWPDSRVRLGYDGKVYGSVILAEVNTFWSRMNGDEGKAKRTCEQARNGTLQWVEVGPTELSSVVTAVAPYPFTTLDTPVAGYVDFSCRMMTSLPAVWAVSGATDLPGECIVTGTQWASESRITFTVKPLSIGDCGVIVTTTALSAGGVPVDGNVDPPGSDGQGPNADTYFLPLYSNFEDVIQATRFEAWGAFEEKDDVRAFAVTDGEHGSRSIELHTEGTGGRLVASLPAAGSAARPHFYEFVIEGAAGPYQIVERDDDPRTPDAVTRPFDVANAPHASLSAPTAQHG
jgi:hypothetical protein